MKFIDLFCGIGGFRLAFEKRVANVFFHLTGIDFPNKHIRQTLGTSLLAISTRLKIKTFPNTTFYVLVFPASHLA